MAKFQIFKKSERKEKYSEINLKKGNPTFLPIITVFVERPLALPGSVKTFISPSHFICLGYFGRQKLFQIISVKRCHYPLG